jgi:3-isopropylmalate/(R)-2-methylmalate dehydratase small subunit
VTPVRRIDGKAYPLGRNNVDTDVIIGAEHLKTITRAGLGRFAFEKIRSEPGNVFDNPDYEGASILIAGENFGCGSSREHAAWALLDLGVRAVIARSFSDIFAGNAFKNSITTVRLDQSSIDRLIEVARDHPISVDLETMTVTTPFQDRFAFEMDPFRRQCLLDGADEIALTLGSEGAIRDYELRTGT